MRKPLLLTTAILLLAVPVLPGELADEVDAAGSIANARIAEIDRLENPTSKEKRELRRHVKVSRALEAYEGTNDRPDLRRVVKAVRLFVAAKSPSPEVADGIQGLLDGLADAAQDAIDLAVENLGTDSSACFDKAVRLIAKANAILEDAEGERAEDSKKASKRMMKSALVARKAIARVDKCRDQADPADVFMVGTTLQNTSDVDIEVTDVEFDLAGTLGGLPLVYAGSAAEKRPTTFPILVEAGGNVDLGQVITGILLTDPMLPDWQPGDSVSGPMTIKTTVGDRTARYGP
jgi:hypothetical protein